MPSWFDTSATPVDGWVPYVMTPEMAARRQRAVSPFVVGVSATDPRLYAAAAATLLLLAMVAALIPIRRAARVDPVMVLREGS